MSIRFTHFMYMLFFLTFCVTAKAQRTYTLRQTLQIARTNNSFLKAERYHLDLASTDITSAKLFNNPTFEFNYMNVTARRYAEPGTKLYSALNNQYALQVSQSFQIAGQRRHTIATSEKEMELAERNFDETQRDLLFKVANAWLAVWSAEQHLEIVHISKKNIDSLVRSHQYLYRNQVITQSDLHRAELLSKQYAIHYKTALQERDNSLQDLQLLLGNPEEIRVDTAANFLFDISANLSALIEQSLNSRSDLQAAHSAINVSNSHIRLQESLAYPQPTIGFFWNPQNAVPYWGLCVTIDLPIFNRNQGNIRKAQVLRQHAEQQLVILEDQLQNEITTAYASYQTQRQNVADFQVIVNQSENILNSVRSAYLEGNTTIIDFFEAQRSWLETQQAYYDVRQAYAESYIALLYATGLINELA